MKQFLAYFIFLSILIIPFTACNIFDDDEAPAEESIYFVKEQKITTYTQTTIRALLTIATGTYPDLADVGDDVVSDVDVYKIVYNTTFNGETVQASGLVCIPTEAGEYPVLSYQNGTNTLHSDAPTEAPNSQLFQLLEMMASTGFIISLPDYLGFGESDDMFHPYLHAESTVQTVTDMLRAIKEMMNSRDEVTFNDDVYVAGYSQGGWATLQLQKALETEYSNEFNIKASACGAGPHDLTAINNYVLEETEYPMPYFLGYLFNSFMNLGMTTDISDVFQAPYDYLIPTLYDGSMSGSEINDQLTTAVADLFTTGYINSWNSDDKYSSVVNLLDENSISAYNTTTPTLILHGTADEFVPTFVSEDLYNDFMTLGVSSDLVTYIPLVGHTHTSGIVPSGLASILWFIELEEPPFPTI